MQGNRNPFIDRPEFAAALFQISTSVEPEPVAPFALLPNAPNPFSSSTSIAFALTRPAPVELVVYDLRGREVRRLVSGERGAGTHTVQWNGRDDAGRPVAAGTYFYRIRTGDAVRAQRMVLVR